jgi:ABC-type amino acid transport substrate-binding protein
MSLQRVQPASLFRPLSLLLLLALVLAFVASAPAAQAASDPTAPRKVAGISPNGVYIVTLADAPTLGYQGGVAGFRPTAGIRDRAHPDVARYAARLGQRQDALLAGVGGTKLASYRYTLNGFAARLTPAQAAQLAAAPDVVAVTPDEKRQIDTSRTPTFLGLDAPGGLWETLGGPQRAGDGTIIGVIDSGLWPESGSFADDGSYRPIAKWRGACVPGEQWAASTCTNKVIGARYYYAGYGNVRPFPYEILSARDFDGHGSHTASTAAGNYGVPVTVDGINFGTVSGMAPRARIAVYKVCWGNGVEGGCFTSDSVSAIEDATMDGVDTINFSISGSQTTFLDPVELAFLEAASAGVFVAASAGNSGPTPGTVAHNSPWITTVAASTHDRDGLGSVTLGNGATYQGKSITPGAGPAPLILSTSAGLASASATDARLCAPGALDPAKVTGTIVVCDRGVIGRTDKSYAVKIAGGVGMILANTGPNSLNADLHYVPTVHVDHIAGAAIKAYVAAAGASATATIAPGQIIFGVEAPFMAPFSSRGPNRTLGDLLKPDITAPGVDVLAAVSPLNYRGRNYDFLSGTSMSSPHIAGLSLLLKDKWPGWNPSMIKSALMTSASQTTNKGNPIDGGPAAYGAGHANPNGAQDPGLVYRINPLDYVRFLCGQGVIISRVGAARCAIGAIDASDLNLPSIAIGDLAGVQTVVRTVTNVSDRTSTYTASASIAGVNVAVSPASLTLKPGESQSYSVTFTTAGAPLNTFSYGALIWSDGRHSVRSPLAIRPVALAAPAAISGTGASGSASYSIKFGYTGPFAARPHGLVPATVNSGVVGQDPDQTFDPNDPTGTLSFQVTIPAGTEYARFETRTADTNDPGTDLDLYVYGPGGTQVGFSAGGTADEQVNLVKPPAGTYTVFIHGWGVPNSPTPTRLYSWALTAASAGNLSVSAPASATLGQTATVTVNWSGLSAATRYLGSVTYHNVASPASYDDGRIGTTLVTIDVP